MWDRDAQRYRRGDLREIPGGGRGGAGGSLFLLERMWDGGAERYRRGREGDTGGREGMSRWLVDSSRENVGPRC